MASRYWELTVPLSDAVAEGLTNFVWELGALGVVEERTGTAAARLRAFFPETATPTSLAARVDGYLASLRTLGFAAEGEARVAELLDGGWAEAWREHFRPTPVGRRLLVAPPWECPPVNGRLVITIEPGRAFGTGQHGSTTGCLVTVEAILERGPVAHALDLGTGSGILAIAAARLGVPAVIAVDDDPDAVAAAVANVARNGVCDRVRCVLGNAREVRVEPVPLVVANLLSAAHLELASRYGRFVLPGGRLVLGGVLDAEAAAVTEALGRHAFPLRASFSVDGWTTLELERAASPSPDAPLHHRA